VRAREDVLGCLDSVGIWVLDRMLRLHKERSAEVVDEEFYPAALLSSLPRDTTCHDATAFFSPSADAHP
jgi:hypothetical protein